MTENNKNLPTDQTKQTDWAQWFAEQKNRNLAVVQMNKANFKEFCEKNGVSKVIAFFDGCGDSGQFESYKYFGEDDSEVDIPQDYEVQVVDANERYVDGKYVREVVEIGKTVDYLVDTMAYNLLEAFHPGWEINEGSFGDVIINKDGTGKIEFNERIETTDYSEDTF